MINTTFGELLRELRLEKGLSQTELAKQLGVGKSIISSWELNQSDPSFTNAIKIARLFDVSLEYLAGLEQ